MLVAALNCQFDLVETRKRPSYSFLPLVAVWKKGSLECESAPSLPLSAPVSILALPAS